MKKHNINITNATTIEAHGNHTNGNTKKCYIVEKKMVCTSYTDAAEVIGCSLDAVSNVIRGKQKTCYGYHIIDLSKAGEAFPQMVACLSTMEATTSKKKAKKTTELSREEMAEFRKWRAEKRAEEKERLRKEKYEAKKAKLMFEIDKHKSSAGKFYAKYEAHTRMQMRAEQKLEALMDNGKEMA